MVNPQVSANAQLNLRVFTEIINMEKKEICDRIDTMVANLKIEITTVCGDHERFTFHLWIFKVKG